MLKWVTWGSRFGSDSDPSGAASFFFHVGFAILFGVSAAMLVKAFAPYACGSGVPEVK